MSPETIKVTITFREPITFHLRMIGVSEESALRQKMFGKTEAEREAESYQNNVDLLADLSEAMPTVFKEVTEEVAVPVADKPGEMESKKVTSMKNVSLVENAGSASIAVREFFSEKSVIKERIAEYAVRGYFVKLVPDLSFS